MTPASLSSTTVASPSWPVTPGIGTGAPGAWALTMVRPAKAMARTAEYIVLELSGR